MCVNRLCIYISRLLHILKLKGIEKEKEKEKRIVLLYSSIFYSHISNLTKPNKTTPIFAKSAASYMYLCGCKYIQISLQQTRLYSSRR